MLGGFKRKKTRGGLSGNHVLAKKMFVIERSYRAEGTERREGVDGTQYAKSRDQLRWSRT